MIAPKRPGEIAAEILVERGWCEVDFARRAGISHDEAVDLLYGDVPVTPEVAHVFATVFGGVARYWLAVEMRYRYPKKGVIYTSVVGSQESDRILV